MKIRNGFVSNSSTSSFILIVKKETHNNVVSQMNEFHRNFVNDVLDEEIVLGIPCYTFSAMDTGDGFDLNVTYTGHNEEDEDEYKNDIFFELYISKLKELADKSDYLCVSLS